MPPPLLNLEGLQMFVTAAERGSYLAAAAELDTSRATIRRQIERLEQELGATLFVRLPEGVRLTAAGTTFVDEAKALLGNARQLVTSVRQAQPEGENLIRIGIQVGYPVAVGAAVNAALFARYTATRIEQFLSERPVDLLPDKVDAVFCLGEQQPSVSCTEFLVAMVPERLYAHPDYLRANGTPPTLDALDKVIAGVWRDPSGQAQVHRTRGGIVDVVGRVVTSDETYLQWIAEQGHGLVYGPLAPAPGVGLTPVLTEQVGCNLRARMVLPRSLEHLPRFGALLDLGRKMMGDMVGTQFQAVGGAPSPGTAERRSPTPNRPSNGNGVPGAAE